VVKRTTVIQWLPCTSHEVRVINIPSLYISGMLSWSLSSLKFSCPLRS
jgi:hypothetical protein